MTHEGTCRFCKKHSYRGAIPYGTRHYACPSCFLERKRDMLATLPAWIVSYHRVLLDAYLKQEGVAGLARFTDDEYMAIAASAILQAGMLEAYMPRHNAIAAARPDKYLELSPGEFGVRR